MQEIQVTAQQFANSTRTNPVLSKFLHSVKTGWPESVVTELHPFFNRRNELTVEKECELWGTRVIVPVDLQPKIMSLLDEMHASMVKMKVLARSYVWWPNLDKDIEDCTKNCESCQRNHNEEQRTPLHPLEYPTQPWQWIHIDFAGPFQEFMWLIVVDTKVIEMRTVIAQRTIQELRQIFA